MMDLKTYRGSSMAEALAEVKKDLGKDAVILHARTTKAGGVLGFGGKPLVEITAAPADAARPVSRSSSPVRAARADAFRSEEWKREADPALATLARASGTASSTPAASPASQQSAEPPMIRTRAVDVANISPRAALESRQSAGHASGPSASQPAMSVVPVASRPVSDLAAARLGALNPPRPANDRPTSDRLSTPTRLAPDSQTAWSSLEDELASIKRLVGQVLQCARRSPAVMASDNPGAAVMNLGGMPTPLFDDYMLMLDAGLDGALAEQIAGRIRDELDPAELADAAIVRNAVLRHIAALVPTRSSAAPGIGDAPLTIALVGPTGVGKTTTIAKVAATYKLRHGRRVGLITSDTYRIAAVDQLRTYANIIGLPLKVALTPQEMASARATLSDCDVLLIDTAGRAPTDAARLDELRRFVDACRPDEVHLTLSAASSEAVLLRAAERFRSAVLEPSHVLFTKLDEAVTLGTLANILPKIGLPIGYVTTGQEVPDQIEAASADRLARLILQRGEDSRSPSRLAAPSVAAPKDAALA